MAVKDAVEVFVHVIEHVHHLHGGAEVAEGGEAHNIAKVNGDLIKQLWLHTTRLLQGAHHRPASVWGKVSLLRYETNHLLCATLANIIISFHSNTPLTSNVVYTIRHWRPYP